MCFLRKRAAASADQAELGSPDSFLRHSVLTQLLKIHISVDGINQLVISTDAPKDCLPVFVSVLRNALMSDKLLTVGNTVAALDELYSHPD